MSLEAGSPCCELLLRPFNPSFPQLVMPTLSDKFYCPNKNEKKVINNYSETIGKTETFTGEWGIYSTKSYTRFPNTCVVIETSILVSPPPP